MLAVESVSSCAIALGVIIEQLSLSVEDLFVALVPALQILRFLSAATRSLLPTDVHSFQLSSVVSLNLTGFSCKLSLQ